MQYLGIDKDNCQIPAELFGKYFERFCLKYKINTQ
ncbi:hypothetical protein M2326_001529 [Flavobacterium sp. 7A]|nr:hypothetical protein [Flavobacterium sp. 7A]